MGLVKSRNVNVNDYDYILFVDGSGDTGIKEGSSATFVVACFLTAAADLQHNEAVLLDIKKAIGASIEHEVKSSTILSHK